MYFITLNCLANAYWYSAVLTPWPQRWWGPKKTPLWTQVASWRYNKAQALIHMARFITRSSKRDKNSFLNSRRAPEGHHETALFSAADTVTFSQTLQTEDSKLMSLSSCLFVLFCFSQHLTVKASVGGRKGKPCQGLGGMPIETEMFPEMHCACRALKFGYDNRKGTQN